MLKKVTMALLMTTTILVGSMTATAADKVTVNQAEMNQAKKIRAQIETINKDTEAKKTKVTSLNKDLTAVKKEIATLEKQFDTQVKPKKEKVTSLNKEISSLKSAISANEKKVKPLLVQAADLETRASKMGKKCQQGSHESIDYIKKHYKNCTNCRTDNIKDGECARVKGAHKHHYCFCDC